MSSTGERMGVAALAAALLAVAGIGWWLQLRPALEVDPVALAVLPQRIGSWRGSEAPIGEAAEAMLQADFNVQREYVNALGDIVWMYVGYYGTERGGHPEHTPAQCYPSAGWAIEDREVVEIDRGLGLRANEFLISRAGRRRLVHFWYRSHRDTGLLGLPDVTVDRLAGRLSTGRADGALVRVSTPLYAGEPIDTARARLRAFAIRLDPLLSDHWPDET